jgi:hypothetical protein
MSAQDTNAIPSNVISGTIFDDIAIDYRHTFTEYHQQRYVKISYPTIRPHQTMNYFPAGCGLEWYFDVRLLTTQLANNSHIEYSVGKFYQNKASIHARIINLFVANFNILTVPYKTT